MSPNQATFFGVAEEKEEVHEEEEEAPKLLFPLKFSPRQVGAGRVPLAEETGAVLEAEVPPITSATRTDKIKALVLCCIMVTFMGVCIGWETHADESHSLFGVVGVACVTECLGDIEARNFFVGREDHFKLGDVSLFKSFFQDNFVENPDEMASDFVSGPHIIGDWTNNAS